MHVGNHVNAAEHGQGGRRGRVVDGVGREGQC